MSNQTIVEVELVLCLYWGFECTGYREGRNNWECAKTEGNRVYWLNGKKEIFWIWEKREFRGEKDCRII